MPIRAIGHTAARGAIRPTRGQIEAEVIGGGFGVSEERHPVVEVDHPPAGEAGRGGRPGRPSDGGTAPSGSALMPRAQRCWRPGTGGNWLVTPRSVLRSRSPVNRRGVEVPWRFVPRVRHPDQSRICDKAVRHVYAADGDVPVILLKVSLRSVWRMGLKGCSETVESSPTARSRGRATAWGEEVSSGG